MKGTSYTVMVILQGIAQKKGGKQVRNGGTNEERVMEGRFAKVLEEKEEKILVCKTKGIESERRNKGRGPGRVINCGISVTRRLQILKTINNP